MGLFRVWCSKLYCWHFPFNYYSYNDMVSLELLYLSKNIMVINIIMVISIIMDTSIDPYMNLNLETEI